MLRVLFDQGMHAWSEAFTSAPLPSPSVASPLAPAPVAAPPLLAGDLVSLLASVVMHHPRKEIST